MVKISVSKGKDGSTLKYFIALLLILFPILDQYAGIVSQVSLGETLLILCYGLFLLKTRFSLQNSFGTDATAYVLMLMFIAVLSLADVLILQSSAVSDSLVLLMRMTVYAVVVIQLGQYAFDHERVYKIYEAVCIAMAVYLLLQYVAYYVFNAILPTYLSMIPVKPSLAAYANRDMAYVYSVSFRPSALFSEPAKLAQFMYPYLLMELYFVTNKSKYAHKLRIMLVCAAMILSTSFMGTVLIIMAFGLSFFSKKITANRLILAIAVALVVFAVLLNTDIFRSNLQRIVSGLTKSSGVSSASLRLLRGWEIFFKLPILNQIFGVGLGNIGGFLTSHDISIKYGGNYGYAEYASTFTYILVTLGILGMIGFVAFFAVLYRRCGSYGKRMIVSLVVMSMGSSFLVTPTWVQWLLVILYYKKICPKVEPEIGASI